MASSASAQNVRVTLGTATPGGGFPAYGDAFIAAHGTEHGVIALEAGSTLLDQFSPRREDYL